MPVFVTKIKLFQGTVSDYDKLSDELKQNLFKPSFKFENENGISENSSIVMSVDRPTLLEVTSTVSYAASKTRKKFSFTIRKQKTV